MAIMEEGEGVVGLLRALHVRLRPDEANASLVSLAPAYERLLRPTTPDENPETAMMHSIQRIRTALRSEPDLFDAVQQFDEQVDACLKLGDRAGPRATWCMSDALRLLLSLAGERDGATFVLEDPTRVRQVVSPGTSTKPRVGERMNMHNLDLVVRTHRSLLHSPSLPFAPKQILARYDFESLGAVDSRQMSLWYPVEQSPGLENSISNPSFADLSSMLPIFTKEAAVSGVIPRLIDISPSTGVHYPTDQYATTTKCVADIHHTNKSSQSIVDAEVFFFDASKVIKMVASNVLDEGTATDVSSCDENADIESTWSLGSSSLPVGSWEDLDKESSEPVGNVWNSLPPLCQRVVERDRVLPGTSALCLEVDETEIAEYAAMALCGIESVLFRRVTSTATFRLPRIAIKLRSSTATSLSRVLEEFKAAGNAFLRLDYLSTYFSQDSSRGGVTAQAFANTVALYLKSYQALVRDRVKSDSAHRTSVSLFSLFTKTRSVRQQIIALSNVLGCDINSPRVFWELLSGRKFPRGVDLLNLLHRELQRWEREDAEGKMTKLFSWLLVRSAEPFVALLSCYVETGQTPFDLDLHGEFQLSVYSTLQSFEGTSGVDGRTDDILPQFLWKSAHRIKSIGSLQRMLNSILAMSYQCAWGHLRLNCHVSAAQAQLQRVQNSLQVLMKRIESAEDSANSFVRIWNLSRPSSKSPRRENPAEWISYKRKRLGQQEVQVLPTPLLGHHECRDSVEASNDDIIMQSQSGKFGHDDTAEDFARDRSTIDQERYMVWRRSRASRLSASKMRLSHMMEADVQSWRTALETLAMQQSKTCNDDSPRLKCGVSDNDSVGIHGAMINQDAESSRGKDSETARWSHDIVGDDGLMWRPRIRIQKVPGGGGSDAASAIYSQNDSQSETIARRLQSIAVTQPSGGDGSAAHTAIYGGGDSNPRSTRDPIGAAMVTNLTVQCREFEMTERQAVTMSNIGYNADDAEMESPSELLGTLDENSCIRPVTMTSDSSEEVVPARNIEEVMQASTNFLRPTMSAEDEGILQNVLQPDRSLPSSTFPFQFLARIALEEPLTLIHDSLDKVALRAILVNLDLKKHLQWLRRIALMSEGLCMTIFSNDLFTNLQSQTRMLVALPGRLTTMLALSMIEARIVNDSAHLPPFEYRVEDGFVEAVATGPATPSMVEVIRHLTLDYALPQHLMSLLTPTSTALYLNIHRFLLLLRVTQHEIKDVWLSWRKSRTHISFQDSSQRLCDIFLHSAQLFLNAFVQAFSERILKSAWRAFIAAVETASSVWIIRDLHERFVSEAHACCFLETDQTEILQSFHALVGCVWSFGSYLRSAIQQGEILGVIHAKLGSVFRTQRTTMAMLVAQLHQGEGSKDPRFCSFAEVMFPRLKNLGSGGVTDSACGLMRCQELLLRLNLNG